MEIYIAKEGDTVRSVAQSRGLSPTLVSEANEIPPDLPLVPGQTLILLTPRVLHTVSPEETLSSVAELYGISTNRLLRNNINLRGLPLIYPGQTLVIMYDDLPDYTATTYGYAYPFIDKALLRQTLPYNTYLAPFTYGFTSSGELVDLDDGALLTLSREYSSLPLMHLSTLTEDGGFDSSLASAVFSDSFARENLIENVLANIQQKGYFGLDIDFEFIPSENAAAYAELVQEFRRRLSPLGKPVIVALAPKTYDEQPGLLYEGHNYALLGQAADFVLLMTYEWGYTYGPPLAVAPIANVRAVIEYALSRLPAEKIFLGIPNYGYDWQLPFVQGESRAQSISNVRAVEIAREAGVSISYDETSDAPYFNYTAPDGTSHTVWFEDARSIDAKLSLIRDYSLYGAGYWNLMRPFPQNWLLLNSRFNIRGR